MNLSQFYFVAINKKQNLIFKFFWEFSGRVTFKILKNYEYQHLQSHLKNENMQIIPFTQLNKYLILTALVKCIILIKTPYLKLIFLLWKEKPINEQINNVQDGNKINKTQIFKRILFKTMMGMKVWLINADKRWNLPNSVQHNCNMSKLKPLKLFNILNFVHRNN